MAEDDDTPTTPKIISRADAKAAGLNRYFTGRPCKNGHVAEHHIAGGCLACRPAQQRARWTENREEMSQRRKARYATDPDYAEKVKVRSANYREQHPDKAKASEKRWRTENPERYLALARERYAADPEKYRARGQAWRDANREHIAEYDRARYAADPEKCRAQARKSAAANPKRVMARAEQEKKRADKIAWQAANPEKVLEEKKARDAAYRAAKSEERKAFESARQAARYAEWKAANPEKARELTRLRKARYRTRKLRSGGSHTTKDVEAIYAMQNGKCAYCKTKVGEKYEVDHIQPLAKGGSNFAANLQILCPTCNRKKNATDPIEYARRLGLLL